MKNKINRLKKLGKTIILSKIENKKIKTITTLVILNKKLLK